MDPLAQPIGMLMRPTFTVDPQDSLSLAARKLRENGCGLVPVTQDGFLSGVITETSLSKALAAGKDLSEAVETVAQSALTAPRSITGAEALRLFEGQGASALVVIDASGRVLGILTPSDLYPKRFVPPRPPMVGGMATPFGVYLTTGSIGAGVGHFALMTTGMILFTLLTVASVLSTLLSDWLLRAGLSTGLATAIQGVSMFAIFLIAMRAIPLSGIHAAEHKVVHAIERGEELIPSIVKRMPRVHPRCGTNLAVGATLFMGLGGSGFLSFKDLPELNYLVAGVVTLIFWKPLGNAMQYYVTTKKPTEKQLAMGIRSGRELLDKYAASDSGSSGFMMRIAHSGMLHVIAGSASMVALIYLIGWIFHIPLSRYLNIGP